MDREYRGFTLQPRGRGRTRFVLVLDHGEIINSFLSIAAAKRAINRMLDAS